MSDYLIHRSHKYVSRTFKNGRWQYVYDTRMGGTTRSNPFSDGRTQEERIDQQLQESKEFANRRYAIRNKMHQASRDIKKAALKKAAQQAVSHPIQTIGQLHNVTRSGLGNSDKERYRTKAGYNVRRVDKKVTDRKESNQTIRNNRPVSRREHITTGNGRVRRTGSGLGMRRPSRPTRRG